MSSSYELCPAFQLDDGYLVIRRVEKAYPVFLRCAAAFFPREAQAAAAMLASAELCDTLADFSAAAARLASQPMLQPFEGGVPVLVYVARPGKEDLFQEFAEGLDQADDFKRLRTLPPAGTPLALVFGDPAVPLGGAGFDAGATAVHLTPVAAQPAAPAEPPPGHAHAASPGGPGEGLPEALPTFEPEMQPLPMSGREREAHTPPTDSERLPPANVVAASTTALNDLLRPEPGGEGTDEAAEQPDPAAFDPFSEPALEVLLRQSPRLQAPELEFGSPVQSLAEAGRGPSSDEVLTAVRKVVGALDEALRRQASEHQNALQALVVATEQQTRALEVRQAEQWERQQAALRQMHAEQAAAIQAALVRLDDERAAWQQQAFREMQRTSAEQLPATLKQFNDDLAARQQQALNKLRDDLLAQQPKPAAPVAGPLTSDTEIQNLNWQLEKSAVSTQDLRQRVGQMLWVNVVLVVALLALALGAVWLLRDSLGQAPAPTETVAATATAPLPTLAPTALPTQPPSTATTAPTATSAATALPLFAAALTCANADRPRNFYDCALTNAAGVTDTLALAVQATGEELHGFNPIVMDEDQERIAPDAATGLFSLGALGPGKTRQVRVMLPCTVVAGCDETTFAITPLVEGGRTIVADQIVEVTTHYFPPDVGVAP